MSKLNYEMVIYWDARDAIFVVEVPELPGCMAHGHTRREAVREAELAIASWVQTAKEDGVEIPAPRGKLMYA
jgi:predicted RNase H-like HicB family nuclease